MKMTRKHFQVQADLCADILSEIMLRGYPLNKETQNSIMNSFCRICSDSNPSFDRLRFKVWVQNVLDGISNP